MKKLTTFQIVLLAVFGALGLAGIMIFALVASVGNQSTLGNVVIWGTFPEVQVTTILRDNADTDNRYLGVSYIKKDPATYEAELTTALANGVGPDLFFMRDDYALHDSSYALHIPYKSFSESQFSTTFLDASSVFLADDGILSVPLLVDPLVMYWNKDSLSTAGFVSPPKYWKDLPPMVTKLVTKSDSGSIIKSGIAFGGYDNISSAKAIISTLILQADGAIFGKDQNGVMRSLLAYQDGLNTAVAALSFYIEFADPSREDYSWTRAFPDAASAFAAGDTALYVGYASERFAIEKANPNLNFAIAPIPQIRADRKAVNGAHVYGLSISRTAKNPQGALTIAYLLAGPGTSEKIASSLQMTSALRRVVDAATVPKPASDTSSALEKLVDNAPKSDEDMLNYAASIAKTWPDPDPGRTNAIFRAMIEDSVSGALKLADAVRRADKQLADILGI